MIRFGISHRFQDAKLQQQTKFKTLHHTRLELCDPDTTFSEYSKTIVHNLETLFHCLEICNSLGIKAFRPPKLAPLYSHDTLGYNLEQLKEYSTIVSLCDKIGKYSKKHDIRITFQPDQHCVLGSPKKQITEKCYKELELIEKFQCLMGISDIVILDLGSIYGSKEKTIERTIQGYKELSSWMQGHLAFMNDLSYRPSEIIDLCRKLNVPFVLDSAYVEYDDVDYDVTEFSGKFEPLIRISTIKRKGNKKEVSFYIEKNPLDNLKGNYTLEVEALYKEVALDDYRKKYST